MSLDCKECCYRYHAAEKARHGILVRINMLQLYCYTCSRIVSVTLLSELAAHF